jgi:glutathione S-transferase
MHKPPATREATEIRAHGSTGCPRQVPNPQLVPNRALAMPNPPRFRIFHVPGTRSMRVLWLCAELGEPLDVVPIDFGRDYRFSPEWLARNPVGKVPAMEVDGFTIFESGAMVEAILDRVDAARGTRSPLRPAAGSDAHALCMQWSWFAEATFARPLGDIAQHTRIKPPAERIPAVVEDASARAWLCLDALEPLLARQPFLLAEGFGAADIMMGYSMMLARNFGLLDDTRPHCQAYFARLAARPGFATAMG